MNIMNEANWLTALVFTTCFVTGYFWYLCLITRVLESFGRVALDNSSMSYLFLLGCTPALYFFTLLQSTQLFNSNNGIIAILFVLCTLSTKTLMQWLAQGIRIPFKIEIDD